MATFKCPDCKKKISLSAERCPKCGRPVTDADREANKPKLRPLWRKVVDFISIVFLIVVIVQCNRSMNSAKNEDMKAMQGPLTEIAINNAKNQGLIKDYGTPTVSIEGTAMSRSVWIDFPSGPMKGTQAVSYSKDVCRAMAIAYIAREKGLTFVRVRVRTPAKGETGICKDLVQTYGVATWDSTKDKITWEPEK